jgi:hypothetical protein
MRVILAHSVLRELGDIQELVVKFSAVDKL